MTNSDRRNTRIDAILAKIDHEAEQGWCSHWADTEETNTALVVTFADGTTRRYSIPRVNRADAFAPDGAAHHNH